MLAPPDRSRSGAGVVAALACALAIAAACAEAPTDVPIPNRPPAVAISAGPIRDSVDVFITTFNWNASDPDGSVDHFNYAIDDTTSPDAWFETRSFELTLLFTAPDSAGVDSIFVGLSGVAIERYRFRGAHTFFIEAVDDDGARSAPAALSFTAETFAPETQILVPSPSVLITLGPTFTVTWQGFDRDGTEDPVGYSWRLVPVPDVLQLAPEAMERVLDAPAAPGDGWSPFAPRLTVQLRDLATPQDYLFGVRALDQAGAIEPRLRSSASPGLTNILRIRARDTGGVPRLRVSSAVKTTDFPTADERRKTFQIPANSNVTFTWEADASEYGGRISGYSWGLDLTDLDQSNRGWSPESAALTRVVLRFDLPPGARAEEHIFYVRARDDVGTLAFADLNLIVVPLSRDRDVLYVDDFGGDRTGRVAPDCLPAPPPGLANPGADWPQDQCQDQYLRQALRRGLAAIGHPEWGVDRYEPLDPRTGELVRRDAVEVDSTSFDYWVYSGPVTLTHLARYKLVVWNLRSEETTQLRRMNLEGEDNFLAVYLEAGGEVWITGPGSFSRTRRDPGGVSLGLFGFEPGDFLHRFLKLETEFEGADCVNGCFRNSGVTITLQRLNGFEGAWPTPVARAEGFPDLRVARAPYAGNPIKGVPSCEGMVSGYGLDVNPRLRLFGGQLDTLYHYQSNGRLEVVPPLNSYMDDAACALRYAGPGQGKLVVFGFPIYFLGDDQVGGLTEAALRWLLQP